MPLETGTAGPGVKQPAEGAKASRPVHHAFLPNLVLLVIVGVGFSAWVLAYTDWFPTIGGLLALGGAFSWIAFVSGLLSKNRQEELQALFDQNVFDRRRTTILVFVIGAVLALLAAGAASVEIDSAQDGATLTTWNEPPQALHGDTLFVPARDHVRKVVRTGLFGARTFRVKVQGLPDQILTVRARQRMRLTIPYSFLRPVLLLQPTSAITGLLANTPMVLEVVVHGQTRRLRDYRGEAVWVGCDADVRVPTRIQEQGRSELEASKRGLLVPRWLYPRGLPGSRIELLPGDVVIARVLTTHLADTVLITRLNDVADFPQLERLHATASETDDN